MSGGPRARGRADTDPRRAGGAPPGARRPAPAR